MGKPEVGTPKYIAKKMKSKGLQKLKWYCQVCKKQCRDENGFKCHTMSESHNRNLSQFAENARTFVDEFSKEFSDGFLKLLKRQFGTKRVPANKVYQDYIADHDHTHMNATMWLTLTDFVKWLGKMGKCVVDETDEGWFVTYIDRDPETIAAKEKKEKIIKDDEEKMANVIKKQVKKGAEIKAETPSKKPLERSDDAPIVLKMKLRSKKSQLNQIEQRRFSLKRKTEEGNVGTSKNYRRENVEKKDEKKRKVG